MFQQSGLSAVKRRAAVLVGAGVLVMTKHTPRIGLFTANQLGALQLDSKRDVEFCVPSFAEFPGK